MKPTILRDSFMLSAAFGSGENNPSSSKQQPLFKGILYEQLDDGFGNPILKKLGENTVVVGGAIDALYKLCGVTTGPVWMPTTLNSLLGIEAPTGGDGVATKKDLTTRIALFGVGNGGHSSDPAGTGSNVWNAVAEKDVKMNNIPGLIPMRRATAIKSSTKDLAEGQTDPHGPDRYYMKKPAVNDAGQEIVEDDSPVYDWYLKEFPQAPVIKSCWKDAPDDDTDGTSIEEEIAGSVREEGIQSFAEFTLMFCENDVREPYVQKGQLGNAHFNSIGLYLGNKTELESGESEYTNVRLFSYLNIDTKSVRIKTTSTYLYRILALV